ncbi:membrane protein [Flammeovirga sp. OC4]|uniref:DoxX family protein n=1 Tax=Flammeovirga sp. OC4 TaxID=1382345 RepID=UPI0005C5DCA5|nr:membrane protein [Flammeovirga sp. OC4]
MQQVKTSTVQNVFRVLLGIAMLYAGIGHMTFRRIAFQAQVPTWLTTDESFIDFVVLASGVVEIAFALLMIYGRNFKVQTGIALGIFFILIFPGNINQYVNHIDSFGLNTDTKRFVRLLFQPLLVVWALWSSGGWKYLKERKSTQ